ncbi:unnamed protein product [Cunninghamella blakesleeana]
MIQTTLLNYFKCDGSTQPSVNKLSSFKQTNLYAYFNTIPKKKNLILDYFKPKKKVQEVEDKVFDLVLVDISDLWFDTDINCVKINMYDPKLKYIAISYRWGELNEQLVKTPDYTAHITSFNLNDFNRLCQFIHGDPDFEDIQYVWIDAISVDQRNKEAKKNTILKMNQIYQNASYILAVPDLHKGYLEKNTANIEVIDLIEKNKETIYHDIYNHQQQQDSKMKLENKIMEYDELKKAYQFLAYLMEDWSNRAWVISEYHIAKEKYKKEGIPLKYAFISVISGPIGQSFFSYHFDDDDYQQKQQYTTNNEYDNKNNNKLNYMDATDVKTFHQFVKERFMQRPHLDMMLNSNAARNEDRFHAILPSWNEYKHLMKDVSKWNITDMISVRLKLYEIINNGDLWDKAKLLHACLIKDDYKAAILPTYASRYNPDNLRIVEKYNYNNAIYSKFEEKLLSHLSFCKGEKKANQIKQLMDEYKMNSKPIWTENLISIQFVDCGYLSIKVNSYFIKKSDGGRHYLRSILPLDNHDEIHE